jgi:hypothetical protein
MVLELLAKCYMNSYWLAGIAVQAGQYLSGKRQDHLS